MMTRGRSLLTTCATTFLFLFSLHSSTTSALPRRSKDSCQELLSGKKPSVRLPKIQPLALKTLDKPFDSPDYQFEMKYDGFRGVAYFERGRRCKFVSREGNDLRQFQPLCEAIADELNVQSAIFDGEVIAYDPTGRPVFKNMMRKKGPFDMWRSIFCAERSRSARPNARRPQAVTPGTVAEKVPTDHRVFGRHRQRHQMFELMKDYDLEGIVAKRLRDKYSRSTKWYKIKNKSYSQAVGRGRFF